MIEISHIVADGCSLTYCQGLDKPWIDGWPALLAKKIGVPVVNLALGGSGNDGIHRRQYDYFYRSKVFYQTHQIESKPLHILGLTFAGRREEFFSKYHNTPEGNRYFTLDLTPDFDKIKAVIDSGDTSPGAIPSYVEYAYFLNFNILVAEAKKLQTWASLVNLYQNNNINYCIGDYIPNYDKNVEFKIKTEYKEIYNLLYSDKNFFGKLNEVTNHLPTLPCGHDGLEAQHILAEYFYNKLLQIHGEIIVKPIPKVYTLKEYYVRDKVVQVMQHSEWYKNS